MVLTYSVGLLPYLYLRAFSGPPFKTWHSVPRFLYLNNITFKPSGDGLGFIKLKYEYMKFKTVLNSITKYSSLQGLNLLKSEKGIDIIAGSLNWAYDQCLKPEQPMGLVNAIELAEEYWQKSGSVQEACDKLIKNELAKLSCVGLLTSAGGFKTLAINLPTVFFMQLRIVIALAHLGGRDAHEPNVKNLCQVCLLGNQAVGMTKKKFIEEGSSKFVIKLAEKLAPQLLGTKGLSKAIPIVSGIIGNSIDVITAYGVARVAKKIFLADLISYEEESRIESERIKLLCNMVLVDKVVAQEEIDFINQVIEESFLSETEQSDLRNALADGRLFAIDYKLLKKDKEIALNILTSVVAVMNADNKIMEEELTLVKEIAKNMNISQPEIKNIIASCSFIS